ncbi:MAG TPA: hypothetical protein VK631_14540 [Solirubrobacteraceae bacterium]|nr:hypothetical protein [Solirubrobacteraceae bacterium]
MNLSEAVADEIGHNPFCHSTAGCGLVRHVGCKRECTFSCDCETAVTAENVIALVRAEAIAELTADVGRIRYRWLGYRPGAARTETLRWTERAVEWLRGTAQQTAWLSPADVATAVREERL